MSQIQTVEIVKRQHRLAPDDPLTPSLWIEFAERRAKCPVASKPRRRPEQARRKPDADEVRKQILMDADARPGCSRSSIGRHGDDGGFGPAIELILLAVEDDLTGLHPRRVREPLLDGLPVCPSLLQRHVDKKDWCRAFEPVGDVGLGAWELERRAIVTLEAIPLRRLALNLQKRVHDLARHGVPKLDVAVNARLDAAGRIEHEVHGVHDALDVSHAPLTDNVAAADLLHAYSVAST